MNPLRSLSAITRRALRIEYRSPLVCMLSAISSSSGTGSDVSALLSILPVARLDGPTNLAAVLVSDTSLTLTWTEQPYIYSYVVYRATSLAGPFAQVTANVIGETFTDTSIPPGTYYYKVTGIEPSAGETYASNIVGPLTLP